MQQAANVLPLVTSTLRKPVSSSSSSNANSSSAAGQSTTANANPVTAETIDRLFGALAHLYGRHWHHRCQECGWGAEVGGQWQSFDRNGEWLQALARTTDAHVRSGLAALNDQAEQLVAEGKTVWPPDSPVLFAKACRLRPETLGWPSREVAWRAVQQHAFAGTAIESDAVRAAVRQVDLEALRVASYSELKQHRQIFLKSYDAVANRYVYKGSIESRAALEDRNRVSKAELAIRASEEKAARLAAPHKSGPGGIAGLRAALRG